MPKLTIQIPEGEEAVYEFDEPQLTIGRNAANDIVIEHDSMSGTHAQLVMNEDGTYTLADNGSTNGTFVNGEQIVEKVLLDGSDVLFGQVGAAFSHPEIANFAAEDEAEYVEVPEPAAAFSGQPLETMGRPANFTNVSPFPKKKKTSDPVATVAMALGFVAIVCAVALVGVVFAFM